MSDKFEVFVSDLEQGVCAVAFTWEGNRYDQAFTWETAQQMANDGYKIVAIANDGAMEKEEIQRICDYENQIAFDCFGKEHKKYDEEEVNNNG